MFSKIASRVGGRGNSEGMRFAKFRHFVSFNLTKILGIFFLLFFENGNFAAFPS